MKKMTAITLLALTLSAAADAQQPWGTGLMAKIRKHILCMCIGNPPANNSGL